MEKVKCYAYTRVSTAIQVEGYSLDAQKEKLKKYAEAFDMQIVKEYSDEGRSGKNLEGRPQFRQMLQDIEDRKDDVSFVLVFKLSRFGRNAADVLYSLQTMQDYGVNLICTDDGIDSSKESGKLLISVLSAVSEIERENIRSQTMAGREQKAREGRWNGGYAPYGYELIDGKLVISKTEAEHVRLIFEKYVNTSMGATAVAEWLVLNGYEKTIRKNGTLPNFSPDFIKKVLDNPVYCGLIAYGRRKTEKIEGKRNAFHVVRKKEFPTYKGIHEAIVSEEMWHAAQEKRKATSGKWVKKHALDHEHLLSGILKCPVCGTAMYGNVNRKKKKDGTHYKDYFFYMCKHRIMVDGRPCPYKRQWAQYKIDFAVEEIISQLVHNPRFEEAIKGKIDAQVDTVELETELENITKTIKSRRIASLRVGEDMDNLNVDDKLYDLKRQNMQLRLDNLYDEILLYENKRSEVEQRILNIREKKIKSESVYDLLLYFDKLYARFSDVEKKSFLKLFVESVEIFSEEQADGRILKAINFNFPIFFNGKEIEGLSWDKEGHVETVVLLQKVI